MSAGHDQNNEGQDGDVAWDGPKWEPVIVRWLELVTNRTGGETAHPRLRELEIEWSKIAISRKHETLTLTPLEIAQRFDAIFDTGEAVINAWLAADDKFFDEVARKLRIQRGDTPKKKERPVEETVIEIARDLHLANKRNPTFRELKREADRLGLVVGDWGKTLKATHLDFIEGIPRRGRPKGRNKSPEKQTKRGFKK